MQIELNSLIVFVRGFLIKYRSKFDTCRLLKCYFRTFKQRGWFWLNSPFVVYFCLLVCYRGVKSLKGKVLKAFAFALKISLRFSNEERIDKLHLNNSATLDQFDQSISSRESQIGLPDRSQTQGLMNNFLYNFGKRFISAFSSNKIY